MIKTAMVTLFLCSRIAFAQGLPAGHPPVDQDKVPDMTSNIQPMDSEQALAEVKSTAALIDPEPLRSLPVHHNGRIKPLDTLARESILFVSGRYSIFELDAIQIFFGLAFSQAAPFVEIVEIRDPELRTELGFLKSKRRFSVFDLERSPLQKMAQPLSEKEQKNSRSLSPKEKAILETFQQVWLARSLIDGSLFLRSIDFSGLEKNMGEGHTGGPIIENGQLFLKSMAEGKSASEVAPQLRQAIIAQPLPDLIRPQMATLEREVFYNKARIFFWAALILFVLGILMIAPISSTWLGFRGVIGAIVIPVLMIAIGFWLRVTITGFAPVTNMYGTMLWVSLGVIIFSTVLFVLYRNKSPTAVLLIASSLLLLLTESLPLTLSPDLDPIVAVLRSNYWLTIHVLTITISYAAFSAAMVMGNIGLVRMIIYTPERNSEFFKLYSHYAYRMIQLGVFLITAGIILGGIWADYSWGRFWGWDPKETWALIADVGFIAILHARLTGWLKDFGVLAAACLAYLLVIMAWYGVNFILAAGLHSYGFSSGGAFAVSVFVGVQLVIFSVSMARYWQYRVT
ncbi:MAG: cytochrome c biogenesis protein CcsA [Bdellovibrionia bacterium]